jgi:hypothetical protein
MRRKKSFTSSQPSKATSASGYGIVAVSCGPEIRGIKILWRLDFATAEMIRPPRN